MAAPRLFLLAALAGCCGAGSAAAQAVQPAFLADVPAPLPVVLPAPPAASPPAPEPKKSEPKPDALAERVKKLEDAAAKAKEKKAEDDRKKEEDSRKKEAEAARKKLADELAAKRKWDVKFGGHVQMDYVNWANAAPTNPAAQDYFEFRRLRLVADGKGYGQFDFRLQFTLEPEAVGASAPGQVTSPDVKDAYFSMNEIPFWGRVRVGNFFVPFGLEQVTNDTQNVFLERSIPTQGIFTADREVGVAVYSSTEDQRLTWTYGLFFDSISEGLKERIDDNQGYRLCGRLTWLPQYEEEGRQLLHVGAGVLYTRDQDRSVRFAARPQIHEGPRAIDSGAIPATGYTVGNLEFAAVRGPFTLQTEAYLASVDRLGAGAAALHGAYAHLSWFLTGENRVFEKFGQHGAQFTRNKPTNNFAFTRCERHWGAVEAKARYSYLSLADLDRGRYQDLTLGCNWYWSDRTRVMFDWIHPFTTAQTPFGTTSQDILGVRFDFNW